MHPLPKRSPETPAFRPGSAPIALKGEVSNQKQMKRGSPDKVGMSPGKEKRPQDWSAQEQQLALQETHGLSGEALQCGVVKEACLSIT